MYMHIIYIVSIAGESDCRVRFNGRWTDIVYQFVTVLDWLLAENNDG